MYTRSLQTRKKVRRFCHTRTRTSSYIVQTMVHIDCCFSYHKKQLATYTTHHAITTPLLVSLAYMFFWGQNIDSPRVTRPALTVWNCTPALWKESNHDLCRRYNVTGYPTIYAIGQGHEAHLGGAAGKMRMSCFCYTKGAYERHGACRKKPWIKYQNKPIPPKRWILWKISVATVCIPTPPESPP